MKGDTPVEAEILDVAKYLPKRIIPLADPRGRGRTERSLIRRNMPDPQSITIGNSKESTLCRVYQPMLQVKFRSSTPYVSFRQNCAGTVITR